MQINNYNKQTNMVFGTQLKLGANLSELTDITPDNIRGMFKNAIAPNKIDGFVSTLEKFQTQLSKDKNPKATLSIAPSGNMLNKIDGFVSTINEFQTQLSKDKNPKAVLSIAPSGNMLDMKYSPKGNAQTRPSSIPLLNIDIDVLNSAFTKLSK